MRKELSLSERIAGLAVAALFVASTTVVPLLHASEVSREPGFTNPQAPATSTLRHDHTVCLQLQTSTARPAAPSAAALLPARGSDRLVLRPTSVTSRDGRHPTRARSPPRRLPL